MKKKNRIIGFRTTRELYAQIAKEALKNNLPISWFLRGMIIDYLKKSSVNEKQIF